MKDTKGMQTGMGQVLDGSGRGLNSANMSADRTEANEWVRKVPKPILASLGDTPGKALLRMANRQNGVRNQTSH